MTYMALSPSVAPLQKQEPLIRKTAEEFVGSFFSTLLQSSFQEINEDESYAMQTYGDFMAAPLAEKIAASTASGSLVSVIENSLRENAGLPSKPALTHNLNPHSTTQTGGSPCL
jgi:hypothetical protein